MMAQEVVLSGFQRYFCMLYTTFEFAIWYLRLLFYQDFKDTFVCYTQLFHTAKYFVKSCFIRISKILLYAIHNSLHGYMMAQEVVLSGFQRYFCMLYTTFEFAIWYLRLLFYQDFKDTFVCYTQLFHTAKYFVKSCFIRISKILLYAIHNLFQPRFF